MSVDFYQWQKMTIVITNKCDLTCKMCSIIRGDKHSLTEEMAMHCADFAERSGFEEIEITGGEPTLVKYFWDFLDRLCQNDKAQIKVTTNGVRLTDDHIRTLASYPNLHVQVSFDGVDDIHDYIRGAKGVFERSAKNLKKMVEAGCKSLSINTVVQRSNFRQMVETYERFKDLPLVFHAFSLIEERDFCPEETITPEECPEFMDILEEIKRRGDADGNDVILSDSLLSFYRWRTLYPHFIIHPGRGCTVVKKSLIVTESGHAIPCWHFADWAFTAESRSLHHHTLDEIVNDERTLNELKNAIGPKGCSGCSTMCYNWDEEFREKVMAPKGKEKLRKTLFVGKEYVRENHPAIFGVAKRVRATLRA